MQFNVFFCDADGSSSGTDQHISALECWKESLLSSTSLPQIFLHLAVLESSIMWSRSENQENKPVSAASQSRNDSM